MTRSAFRQASAYLQLAPSAEYLRLREAQRVCVCVCVSLCEEGGAF